MSLLDQLWDDTLAGPRPENGLGKLRKHSSFGQRPISGKGSEETISSARDETAVKVTRSIMIAKPASQSDSPVGSPGGSTPPVSPFSGGRESFRFRRKSTSDAFEKAGGPRNSPSSTYDV